MLPRDVRFLARRTLQPSRTAPVRLARRLEDSMFCDDGYDTDDTDEIFARKTAGTEPVMMMSVVHSGQPAKQAPSEEVQLSLIHI